MKEERLRILTMLQEGKITPEEAERLLAALSGGGRSDGAEGPGPGKGKRSRGWWDFDFDFTRGFDSEFRKFGPIFDEEFRRKFQDKMHRIQRELPAWVQQSGQQAQATRLTQELTALMKDRKWQEADKVADELLSLMSQGEKK